MNRNALFLIPLVAVVAFALWIVMSEPDGLQVDPTEETNPEQTNLNEALAEDVSTAVVEAVGEPVERTSIESTAVAPLKKEAVPHYGGEDGIVLTLVDDESQEPLPGAELYYMERAQVEDFRKKSPKLTPIQSTREWGKRFVANELGQVRINPEPRRSCLLAESGTRISFLKYFDHRNKDHTISLEENQTLTVRVVDKKGVPIPHYPISTYAGGGAVLYQIETYYCDEDGVAVLDEVQKTGTEYSSIGKPFVGISYIGFNTIKEGDQLVQLDEEVRAKGEVQLVGDAVGGMEVTVLDHDGKPFSEEGLITIALEEAQHAQGVQAHHGGELDKGRVRFENVGLNRDYLVAVNWKGFYGFDRFTLAGPKEIGEWVQHEVQLPARHVLTGVLLDDLGDPISNGRVAITEVRQAAHWKFENARTVEVDENGRFRYVVSDLPSDGPPGSPPPPMHENPLQRLDFIVDRGEVAFNAQVPVQLPDEPIALDLGEIRMGATHPVLSGRVVNEEGNPLAGIQVDLSYFVEQRKGVTRHHQVDGARADSDKNGKFSYAGEIVDGAKYELILHHPDFHTVVMPIELPALNHEVVMLRTPRIHATLLVDDRVGKHDFVHEAKYEGRDRTSYGLTAEIDPGKVELDIPGVPNIPFELQLRTTSGEVLYTSSKIQLTPGEIYQPAELNPLDLRGKLKVFTIRAVDEIGDPISARVTVIEGERRRESFGWGGGEARFLTLQPIENMLVQATGYRTVTLTDVHSDQEVVMQKAMVAALQVPEQYLEYRNGVVELRGVSWIDENDRRRPIPTPDMDESGKTTVYFDQAGDFQVYLTYQPKFGSEELRWTARSHSRQVVSLQTDGQEVMLSIDQDDLDKAVDQFLKDAEEEGD